MTTQIRAFLAVKPPEAVCRTLAEEQEKIQIGGVRIRPVPVENIHLTIQFLGAIQATRIPAVREMMDSVGLAAPPLRLQIGEIGAFPTRRPVVIAAGISANDRLEALVANVRLRLRAADFNVQDQPYRPHITLARIKRGRGRGRGPVRLGSNPVSLGFQAAELILFRSDQTPTGALYTRLHTTRLGAVDGLE